MIDGECKEKKDDLKTVFNFQLILFIHYFRVVFNDYLCTEYFKLKV